MKPPQHTQLPVAQLWQMPPDQLRLYARVATKLADLHAQIERAAADGMQTPHTTAKQRQPMRAPRAGSLRETVHTVLSEAGPDGLPRKEIARRAAIRRGVPDDTKFATAVGMVLRDHEHDNGIRRLARGTYAAGYERRS